MSDDRYTEAIDAAYAAYMDMATGASGPDRTRLMIRAAALIIERDTLLRAADEIAEVIASHRPTNIQWSHMDLTDSIYDSGMAAAEKMLRDRAASVGGDQ